MNELYSLKVDTTDGYFLADFTNGLL